MPARVAAKKAPAKTAPPAAVAAQVPDSPPVRVEIRINGRVRFADTVYGPLLSSEDGEVTFTATTIPVLVDAPVLRAPELFVEDRRNSEDIIQQVHSGRRT